MALTRVNYVDLQAGRTHQGRRKEGGVCPESKTAELRQVALGNPPAQIPSSDPNPPLFSRPKHTLLGHGGPA